MRTSRFCPSRVRVPDQLEEILLRIVLACFESPVPVLAYLASLSRRLNPEAIPADGLDLPLRRLADIVQEILAKQKPLSANSVAAYLDDLRYQLDRSPTRIPAGPNLLGESVWPSGVPWRETRLRDYLSHDIEAGFEELVSHAARRIGRVRLRWRSRKIFAVFAAARYQDVLIYFQGRYGLDASVAQELTQESFIRIQQRLSKFDPRRARLIAFTFHEVWLVVRAYWKRLRQRSARERSLEGINGSSTAVERSLAESVPPEPDPDREARKSRLAQLLFRLDKPPHQIIVFILCRLLGLSPLKILEKYSRLPLHKVARIAEREYRHASEGPSDLVRIGFTNLRARLNQPLAELVGGDKRQAALGSLVTSLAGDIRLARYFPGKAPAQKSKEITKDWNSVQKALVIHGRGGPPFTSQTQACNPKATKKPSPNASTKSKG